MSQIVSYIYYLQHLTALSALSRSTQTALSALCCNTYNLHCLHFVATPKAYTVCTISEHTNLHYIYLPPALHCLHYVAAPRHCSVRTMSLHTNLHFHALCYSNQGQQASLSLHYLAQPCTVWYLIYVVNQLLTDSTMSHQLAHHSALCTVI
jgi:hypothetical protein